MHTIVHYSDSWLPDKPAYLLETKIPWAPPNGCYAFDMIGVKDPAGQKEFHMFWN